MLFTNFHIYQMSWAYRTYTYEELLVATDNKAPTNLLGVGEFGKVFLGRARYTNVAIKFFHQVSVDMAIFFMIEVLMQYPYYTMYVITLLRVVMS